MMKKISVLISLLLLVYALIGCDVGNRQTNHTSNKEIYNIKRCNELEIVSGFFLIGTHNSEEHQYKTPTLITSYLKWTQYLKKYSAYEENHNELIKIYDKRFFNHSVIYAYPEFFPSGPSSLTVRDVKIEGENLEVFMKRKTGDAEYISAGVCFVGIQRNAVKNIKHVTFSD